MEFGKQFQWCSLMCKIRNTRSGRKLRQWGWRKLGLQKAVHGELVHHNCRVSAESLHSYLIKEKRAMDCQSLITEPVQPLADKFDDVLS